MNSHVQRLGAAGLRRRRSRQGAEAGRRAAPTSTRRCRRSSAASTSTSSTASAGSGASSSRPRAEERTQPARASASSTSATTTARWCRCRRCRRRGRRSGRSTRNRFNLYRAAQVTGARGARLQLGPGARRARGGGARDAAARDRLRLGRPLVPGAQRLRARAGSCSRCRSCFVFLILAALYESWSLPFSRAAVGAGRGLRRLRSGCCCASFDFDVYAQIGIVMLIGLAAKNAILIVEFAKAARRSTAPTLVTAALEGAQAAAAADPDDVVRLHPRLRAAVDRDRRRAPPRGASSARW